MNAYTYNNLQVLILRTEEVKDAQPIHTCGEFGLYRAEEVPGEVGLPAEDEYEIGYNGESEIDCALCANLENEQALQEGYWTKQWIAIDRAERELVTRTTSYHDWTSRRTEMERQLSEAAAKGLLSEAYANELRQEWENAPAEVMQDFDPELWSSEVFIPSFDELIEAAGVEVGTPLERAIKKGGYQLHSDLREAIAAALDASQMNAAKLSTESGVSVSSISRFLSGKDGLTYDNLTKLLHALGIRQVF